MKSFLRIAVLLASAVSVRAEEAGTTAVHGQVTDPSGAAVGSADVRIAGPSGKASARTDAEGRYRVAGLAPGTYAVAVTKDGFAPYETRPLKLAPGRDEAVDVRLALAPVEETVTVEEKPPAVSLQPDENAGAIVIKGEDLDALPDDPDEMMEALQTLAGPAAGPNGGQVFIDGFTGGRIPPKSSIREIRLNANPYSAEFDRLGYGRIEIFTKPGTDKLRGDTSFRFNDDVLNTRNPFSDNKQP
jgi:carboxypeptidase family protein